MDLLHTVDITYFLEDDTFSKLQTITIDEIKKYYQDNNYVKIIYSTS